MTLYDIDRQIEDLIDPDTGEITDFAALDALQMDRSEKVGQIARAYRNALAEASAIGAEVDRLAQREKTAAKRADSLKEYLSYALNGESYKDSTVTVYYRKTTAVVVEEDALLPEEFLRYGSPPSTKRLLERLCGAVWSFLAQRSRTA
jgi:hypothetical protein